MEELQNRGAVHYHLLAWLPRDLKMPHWDKPVLGTSSTCRREFVCHCAGNCRSASRRARTASGRARLDITAAAQLLKVHPKTLEKLARSGAVPSCKVGRAWVFVEQLLIDHLVTRSL